MLDACSSASSPTSWCACVVSGVCAAGDVARHARRGAAGRHVRGLDLIDPGIITDRGNRLVSNKHLSLLCVRCGLHKHLRTGLPAVRHLVGRFEAQLEEFAARDEEEYEVRAPATPASVEGALPRVPWASRHAARSWRAVWRAAAQVKVCS